MLSKFVCTCLLVAVSLPVAAQSGPQDLEQAQKIADARAGLMKVVGAYFGPIYAMAQGYTDFDAETAERNAHKLRELADMAPDMFRTDTRKFEVKTEALDEVWEDYDHFVEDAEKMKKASAALESAASEGKDAVVAAFQKLGGTCKDCHDEYRLKK